MSLKREMSSTFRRSLLVAIPVASVVGLTALAYAGLTMFSAGDQLSASTMNANFASLQAQISALQTAVGVGPDGGTPTLGGAPSGTIEAFGGIVDGNPGDTVDGGAPAHLPPTGWLLCNGDELNGLSSNYAALYAAIGTSFGGSAASQQFYVPDLRGRFLRGVDLGAGHDPDTAGRTPSNTGGQASDNVGSLQGFAAALPNNAFVTNTAGAHTHDFSWTVVGGPGALGAGAGLGLQGVVSTTASAGDHNHTVAGGGDSETRPVNINVNYIIKL